MPAPAPAPAASQEFPELLDQLLLAVADALMPVAPPFRTSSPGREPLPERASATEPATEEDDRESVHECAEAGLVIGDVALPVAMSAVLPAPLLPEASPSVSLPGAPVREPVTGPALGAAASTVSLPAAGAMPAPPPGPLLAAQIPPNPASPLRAATLVIPAPAGTPGPEAMLQADAPGIALPAADWTAVPPAEGAAAHAETGTVMAFQLRLVPLTSPREASPPASGDAAAPTASTRTPTPEALRCPAGESERTVAVLPATPAARRPALHESFAATEEPGARSAREPAGPNRIVPVTAPAESTPGGPARFDPSALSALGANTPEPPEIQAIPMRAAEGTARAPSGEDSVPPPLQETVAALPARVAEPAALALGNSGQADPARAVPFRLESRTPAREPAGSAVPPARPLTSAEIPPEDPPESAAGAAVRVHPVAAARENERRESPGEASAPPVRESAPAAPTAGHTPSGNAVPVRETPTRTPEVRRQGDPAPRLSASETPPRQTEGKALPAPREISLHVGSGGHRVDLRIIDRGGAVHVAVRTPDSNLSNALRQDLPELSSRLERSGFRTEAWHPGAAPELTLAAAMQGNDTPGGQRQQRNQQEESERRPQHRRPQPEDPGSEGAASFARLISSLR